MPEKPHILRVYDKALKRYTCKVDRLFQHAAHAVASSHLSLRAHDDDTAAQIIANDKKLDKLHARANRDCVAILASYSPVSIDLDYLLSTARLATMLERLGDYSVHIAKHAIALHSAKEPPPQDSYQSIVSVLNILSRHIGKMSLGFHQGDLTAVGEYHSDWIRRDNLATSLTEQLTASSADGSVDIPVLAQLIFISRDLEYIWDAIPAISELLLRLPYILPTDKPLIDFDS